MKKDPDSYYNFEPTSGDESRPPVDFNPNFFKTGKLPELERPILTPDYDLETFRTLHMSDLNIFSADSKNIPKKSIEIGLTLRNPMPQEQDYTLDIGCRGGYLYHFH
jgi:hypothetical protein